MNYRFSSAAQSDLDECWFYIAQDDPRAADRFLDAIEEKVVLIATHPQVGRKCDELAPNLLRFPVGSYVIFYRLQAKHVEIVRILHGARDIEGIFNPRDEP